MPPMADPLAGPVRVARAGDLITISVHGRLDAHAGVELLATLQGELDGRPPRVDVDLVAVDHWTPEGARALRRACTLAHGLPAELHYRTAAGAGHEALLAAFDGSADDESDGAGPGDSAGATEATE